MVACTGLLATICWSARQARKGAAEPSDSSAEIWLVWVHRPYILFWVPHSHMSYIVLARKWRPKTFSEVVGQQHVLRALINGLDQNRLHHAFLFSGTRGVGKTTLARILAKSLNCEQGVSSTPCGECQSCQEVDAGRFVDLIEVDAASRTKVDDTRELLDNVQYAPSRGRYKVYLIDEVHMLSTSSFNALLKTLEEPPPHVKFLFATTDPQKLPVTILSRCLQFNLRRIERTQISDYLANILQQENFEFDNEALTELAIAADGSMRDALSLLDQAISFGDGNVNSEHVHQMLGSIKQQQLHTILTALLEHDGKTLLEQSQELSSQGRDFNVALNSLLALLQRIATLQMVPTLDVSDEDEHQKSVLFAQKFSPETIQLLYQIALHGKRDLSYAADPKSGFDMTLLRMLSFQPKQTDINTHNITPKENQQPSQITKAKADTQSPVQYKQTPPPTKTTEIAEPTPATLPPTEKSASVLSSYNWTQAIASLDLSAFARQLADNCAFIKMANDKIHLSLAEELRHLATTKAQERLTLALHQHLNIEIVLVFEQNVDTENNSPTLATERTEQASIKQQSAVESIHNDPAVDAIKQAFGARIIESSIKPIN